MAADTRHRGRQLRRAAAASAFAALALPVEAPGAESVYVANALSQGTLSQFAVGAFGGLAPLSPATVGAGVSPFAIAIAPDGRDVYVAAISGGNPAEARVWQYDAAAAGTLTPKSPASVANGRFPQAIAISPDGASVYTADSSGVGQYDVGPGGALTAKTPESVPSATGPSGVAVSPDGRSVYVTNGVLPLPPTPPPQGTVSQYDVDSAGRLTPKATPTVPADAAPGGIAASPDGRSVYVANRGSNTVSQYDVGSDGALTPKTPPTVGTGAQPARLAVSADGRSVYVTNVGGGSVSQYGVGPGGTLAPMSSPTVPTDVQPWDIAVSPDSRRVYVSHANGPAVRQFHAGTGGALSPMAPASVPSSNAARGIAITPRAAPVAAATAGASGLLAAFDGSGSSSRDGSIARYDWDFGDGRVVRDGGPAPAHLYAAAGTYQVTLTVTDEIGCSTGVVFTGQTASCGGGPSARTTLPVTVSVPPVGSGPQGPPGADGRDRLAVALAARRYRAPAGRRLRVAFASTMAGRATLEARRGRRTVARSTRRVRAGAGSLSLRVRRAGRYTLRLTVRSTDGQRRTASARLTVR